MSIYDEIRGERALQDAKWGEQNHPDLHPLDHGSRYRVKVARDKCAKAVAEGRLSWHAILTEEVAEAEEQSYYGTQEKMREELVQVAAVVVAWIEALDRRKAKESK